LYAIAPLFGGGEGGVGGSGGGGGGGGSGGGSGSGAAAAAAAAAAGGGAPAARRGDAGDADLLADLLRTLQMDLEGEVAKRRSLDGALARLSGAPEALAELSADGLAALEEELEASLRLVRAAKERRMRAALGEEQNRALCAVCLASQKEALFLPCKHLCACAHCAATIMKSTKTCPICRAPVANVLNVYA
jgi:rubrerythrin